MSPLRSLQPVKKNSQFFQNFFFFIFPTILVLMFLSTLRCNREFKLRDKLMKENPERLRGFVLFLAELFQQLEIQASVALSFNQSELRGFILFLAELFQQLEIQASGPLSFGNTGKCVKSFSSSWKYRWVCPFKSQLERLRGCVLFLAELFQQLEIQASVPLSIYRSDCGDSFSFWQSFFSNWKYRRVSL